MVQDKIKEIAHNRNIKEKAEFFWGWDTPAGKLRAARRARIIIDEMKKNNCTRILEIGSGTGMFTKFFCKERLDVNGIDISFELLKGLKAKIPDSKCLKLIISDAENLAYHDNSFDAVVGVCVLHHLNVEPVLKELKRVLRKGGLIVFSEPNMMNPQLMIQKNIKPIKRLTILGETEEETAFFRWQMKGLLRRTGFTEISVEPFDFLHPWTPKPLIPFVKAMGRCLERTPLLREISGSLLITAIKQI